jgi:hypothetical protein
VPKRSAKLFYLRNELALADILLAIALRVPTKSDAELGAALRFVTSNVLEAVIRFLQSADLPSATLARLLQRCASSMKGMVIRFSHRLKSHIAGRTAFPYWAAKQ